MRQRCNWKLGAGPELDAVEPMPRLVAHRGVARRDTETIEADLRHRLHRQTHIHEHREARVEIDQLERAAEPEPRAVGCAEPRDVLAEQAHAAGCRAQLSRDQIEVGRLAGAVRPDDRGQRALVKRAGHGIDRDLPAEIDGQIAGRQSRDVVVHSTPYLTNRAPDASSGFHYRLLAIGIFISSMVMTCVSSGIAQGTFGSTLILKAYMGCSS